MRITFEIDDFGDEAASQQAVAEGRAPEEPYHLWGRIVLQQPGQPSVVIDDDLTLLGLALCADVPAALRRDGRAQLHLAGWPGKYSFVAEAGSVPALVHLTGSKETDVRLPQDELLQGLHACGQRLAVFIRTLAVSCPQYARSGLTLAANLAKEGT